MPILLTEEYANSSYRPLWDKLGVNIIPAETGTIDPELITYVAVLSLMPDPYTTARDLIALLGRGSNDQIIKPIFLNGSARINDDNKQGEIQIPLGEIDNLYASGLDITTTIVTGADIDRIPYDTIRGRDQLETALDLAHENSKIFSVCWGAGTVLRHIHGIENHIATRKTIGVYDLVSEGQSPLMQAWDRAAGGKTIGVPNARWFYINDSDIRANPNLIVHANMHGLPGAGEQASIALVSDQHGHIYSSGHFEYGPQNMQREHERDSTNEAIRDRLYPLPEKAKIPYGQPAPWAKPGAALASAIIKAQANNQTFKPAQRHSNAVVQAEPQMAAQQYG